MSPQQKSGPAPPPSGPRGPFSGSGRNLDSEVQRKKFGKLARFSPSFLTWVSLPEVTRATHGGNISVWALTHRPVFSPRWRHHPCSPTRASLSHRLLGHSDAWVPGPAFGGCPQENSGAKERGQDPGPPGGRLGNLRAGVCGTLTLGAGSGVASWAWPACLQASYSFLPRAGMQ